MSSPNATVVLDEIRNSTTALHSHSPHTGQLRKLCRVQTLLRTYTHPGAFTVEGAPGSSRRTSRIPSSLDQASNPEFSGGGFIFFCFCHGDRGDPRSNISLTRGRPDTRFCVCASPRAELSDIASLTPGCSRSDFFRSIRRVQDHTCWGSTDTANR